MKIEKLALTISILSMTHGVSVSLGDQGCEAVAGPDALCEQDADGFPITGSVPVGVIVGTDVRDAMQHLLFPGTICDPAHSAHDTVGDSRYCMPSLASSELASILTGTKIGWQNISTENGTVGGTNGVPITAAGMRICGLDRGVQTMGQAAINWAGSCAVPTYDTNEGNSIAAVESCLITKIGKAAHSAIGILPISQSRPWDYNFIKVDGVAPTLDEHLAGNYPLVANVAGTPQFKKFYHPWGVAGGALIDHGFSGGPSKDTSGVAFGCAPLRPNAIYQDK